MDVYEQIAPRRLKPPATREELLLPLTLRERACIAAIASVLRVAERESEDDAITEKADFDTFVVAGINLLAAYRQVTGSPWSESSHFWED